MVEEFVSLSLLFDETTVAKKLATSCLENVALAAYINMDYKDGHNVYFSLLFPMAASAALTSSQDI